MRGGCAHRGGLGHMQAAARLDPDAGGDSVPAAQLAQRDAEAVGDGDQRIAPAHGVEPGARKRLGDRRHRNHQRLDARDAVGWTELIG